MKGFLKSVKRSKTSDRLSQATSTSPVPQTYSQESSAPGQGQAANHSHYTHQPQQQQVPRNMPATKPIEDFDVSRTTTSTSKEYDSSRNGETNRMSLDPTPNQYASSNFDASNPLKIQVPGSAQLPAQPSLTTTTVNTASHHQTVNKNSSMPPAARSEAVPVNRQTIEEGLVISRGPALVNRETKGKYHLEDFSILRTLGTGSFGRVHLVQSRHNSRFYAIKVLKKAQVVKMKQVEHTNDERNMLRKVKHPFLITLWGTFFDSKNLYMVMDFIEGGELFSLLRKSQRFPNPVAKFYAAEVALALDFLHHNDIIYRDLKPENLLLDRHGHIKITDFGFAKQVPDITWTLCGTPDYLAPEVVASKGYNKSVDWWSLGILTFEMLAGYPPFYDQNPMKLYENILNGKVRYPTYFEAAAQDFLQKLLTSDLTKRYGNLVRGSRDVMEHAWFSEVNWERLARRDIEPPYCPPLKSGAGDAHLFDAYPEETVPYGASGTDEYGHLFPEF